ncbi:MFS general substrate transporter [Gloeophyllum trabeum ATCC 11539]|uniref:MFS general substrate transporter n=1 Tax=Gloeophyllum trabeum (strain ATCC 11539 / FP-39264 / Madison 617) TaxID=670483 RepID=S7RZG1_GLOTA|nr:MFS general substrate transporter [Gloeophyllum trabeum ATCC 11539]EPQ60395.1 MFS general substrate transporter [Gloeophyllum trabeum ATCC 11539]
MPDFAANDDMDGIRHGEKEPPHESNDSNAGIDSRPQDTQRLEGDGKDAQVKKGDIDKVEKPFSIYTSGEKWLIVSLAAFGGLFSPLTANIYFPAIPTIATAFHKSIELINVTVTVYMIMQGLSPMVWGTMADKIGRRPIFVACLLILSLSCVGLALVPTDAYWLLVLLRGIQAAGSASTIALGAGVVGDIATPAERRGFFGLYNVGPMVGPSIGPIVGGALAGHLGWRAIFWFMCIAAGLCCVFIFLVFPETLRALVGDGSIPPPKYARPPIALLGRRREHSSTERPPKKRFQNPLRLFLIPEIIIPLIFSSVVFAVLYGFTTPMSNLFMEAYPFLNETDIGLCYLANGGGMLMGSTLSGRLLDKDYQRLKRSLMKKIAADPEKRINPDDITKSENWPVEKARLRTLPYYVAVLVAVCCGYGWCLQEKVSIAAPLVLQILVGFLVTAFMTSIQTLIVDLAPTQSSAVTACNNVVRCSVGAALVSVVELILTAIGPGWTYVLFGGLVAAFTPLLFLVMHMGPKWRARRRAKRQEGAGK